MTAERTCAFHCIRSMPVLISRHIAGCRAHLWSAVEGRACKALQQRGLQRQCVGRNVTRPRQSIQSDVFNVGFEGCATIKRSSWEIVCVIESCFELVQDAVMVNAISCQSLRRAFDVLVNVAKMVGAPPLWLSSR